MEKNEKKELFWADQIANKIIERETFRYSDKKMRKFDKYTSKSAASLSGVLHIGRLSDVIRHISVHRALLDKGVKSRVIWIADDTDPLRKIPKGMPADFEKYIGAPVDRIPDFEKCHKSYADHHIEEYLGVIHKYSYEDLEIYRMSEEYKKSSFTPQIKKILANVDKIREIQNKHRTNPLKKDWSPWRVICENCGKSMTAQAKITEDGKAVYRCKDYTFETTVAKGCGHKAESNPLKDDGKLAFKSEWAAQWDFWQVTCEGAGKEYQVPNSAYWINQEISESVLDFPGPEPFFYEHLFIDGTKMSASLGNVIYPKGWLQVATPELLRFFYNKRLMMHRTFSWRELPHLYDEYDEAAKIFAGQVKVDNEKEEVHLKRQFEISNKRKAAGKPLEMSFIHASMIAQTFKDDKSIISNLKKTGQYEKSVEKELLERVAKASEWVKLYAPEEYKFEVKENVSEDMKKKLSPQQKKAISKFAKLLKSKSWKQKELINETKKIFESEKLKPNEFFEAAYLVLLGKEKGPRLVPFVLTLGDKAVNLFEQI